ncbi:hypothetical protein Q7A53_05765 [Halobacillus rhizosphaerae]|uniref:hypothetical protein n=1 Tax=Halobacillus rhizosphaerae TaxID=3064889 RepID=UPI00398A9BBC
MSPTDNQWANMRLLNKNEIKHCIESLIRKEPAITKKLMIRWLHHITIHRYMRQFQAQNPMVYREYEFDGMKRVNSHNELILNDLHDEGVIRYEKDQSSYEYKGKVYNHYIIIINK